MPILITFLFLITSANAVIFDTRGGNINVFAKNSAGAEAKLLIPEPPQNIDKVSLKKITNFLKNNTQTTTYGGEPNIIPWNYTEDGCFVRAELVRHNLDKVSIPSFKVFAFGNFINNWNFHIVNAVLGADGNIYIIDLATSNNLLMTLFEWKQIISLDKNIKISFCSKNTYREHNHCFQPKPISQVQVLEELRNIKQQLKK